jgi:hypothetical protein
MHNSKVLRRESYRTCKLVADVQVSGDGSDATRCFQVLNLALLRQYAAPNAGYAEENEMDLHPETLD